MKGQTSKVSEAEMFRRVERAQVGALFNFEGPRKRTFTNGGKHTQPREANLLEIWGCSSAGRAPALQAGGRQFDSVHLHHGRNAASSSEENRKT